MKKLLLFLIIMMPVIAFAQNVAINNDAPLPDNSALLDIKSTSKSLLTQEVEKVLPEIVSTDSEGYKSVDYGKMNALLIQAVNQLTKKVNALELQHASQKK